MTNNSFTHSVICLARTMAFFVAVTLVGGVPSLTADASAKKVQMRLKTPSGTRGNKETAPGRIGRKPQTADSLTLATIRPSVTFSGFDKPASSRKETFLISNNSGYDIARLKLQIIYSDLEGRMLHSRDEEIDVYIPSCETRLVMIPSFDPQGTLYYKESRPPKNGGQPFQVNIYLLEVFLGK